MPVKRRLHILLAVTAHFYYFIFYRYVLGKSLKYPATLYKISKWRSLVHLNSQSEHRLAFRILSKLAGIHNLNNKCLEVSVVMFWLSINSAIIRFSLNAQSPRVTGHAWFELDGQIYTVATDNTKWPTYSLLKSDAIDNR